MENFVLKNRARRLLSNSLSLRSGDSRMGDSCGEFEHALSGEYFFVLREGGMRLCFCFDLGILLGCMC